MTFGASLSGLNAYASAIDVVGNNIANSQTIGFKKSGSHFATALSGVAKSTLDQRFDQGTILQSTNPMDLAISGLGFFRLNDSGKISYSRDGQFSLGYDASTKSQTLLVNRTGLNVTGYLADYTTDPRGVIPKTAPTQNISVDPIMPALSTSLVSASLNLDGRSVPPVDAVFAPGNEQSYNSTTALTVFDSTGTSHDLRMYFSKQSPGNLWDLHTTLDGAAQSGPVKLSFTTNGLLTTPMPLVSQTYALNDGGSLPVILDFSGTVQYGKDFGVSSVTQNGYASGIFDSASPLRIGNDGVLEAAYSNGQSRKVAQLALANFDNPGALISIGNNQWLANLEPVKGSGVEHVDKPLGSLGFGVGSIQGSATEQSNVDLTNELIDLIEQQRNYQASAQSFKILDQVLQNLTQGI